MQRTFAIEENRHKQPPQPRTKVKQGWRQNPGISNRSSVLLAFVYARLSRHAFFETDEKLELNVFIKDPKPDQVNIVFEPRKVSY
jgi:hypothetical protein